MMTVMTVKKCTCNAAHEFSSIACCVVCFYRAMHCSAKRGIAIACRLSVRPSVRL